MSAQSSITKFNNVWIGLGKSMSNSIYGPTAVKSTFKTNGSFDKEPTQIIRKHKLSKIFTSFTFCSIYKRWCFMFFFMCKRLKMSSMRVLTHIRAALQRSITSYLCISVIKHQLQLFITILSTNFEKWSYIKLQIKIKWNYSPNVTTEQFITMLPISEAYKNYCFWKLLNQLVK